MFFTTLRCECGSDFVRVGLEYFEETKSRVASYVCKNCNTTFELKSHVESKDNDFERKGVKVYIPTDNGEWVELIF